MTVATNTEHRSAITHSLSHLLTRHPGVGRGPSRKELMDPGLRALLSGESFQLDKEIVMGQAYWIDAVAVQLNIAKITPHPNPLPQGEREREESPLPLRERSRVARVRGQRSGCESETR
jgi:hypothetical protein